MKWGEFFKPNWQAIVLFLVLFTATSFVSYTAGYSIIGLPLAFYAASPCFSFTCGGVIYDFSLLYFIFDLIFWFLISLAISAAYRSIKK
jgi:hypothetical protein